MRLRFARQFLYAMGSLLVTQTAYAQAPLGPQFQVNSYTTGYQSVPEVVIDADGDFVVIWESFGSLDDDTSSLSIQGQRFAADGSVLGAQFQVNSYTTSAQDLPGVAASPGGGFIVVWGSDGSNDGDTSFFSIQGQRFAADGSALGAQFQVNSYTTNRQALPDIAASPGGGFVVVWESLGSNDGDTFSRSVQGQRFAADGSALGPQFQVNSYTTGNQYYPAVAMSADGGFVVVWESDGSDDGDTSGLSIQGQRFAADGSTLASQFQVNSYTTLSQERPAVATDPDGDFVVVWMSASADNGDTSPSIQGQCFAADGSALGSQFLVNSYTTSSQRLPDVAASPGGFVVVWDSFGSNDGDTFGRSVQGQRFAADGSALGSQFQINSYTTSGQLLPAIATDSFGGFVVVWVSYGSDHGDTSGYSIQGQRFPVRLFADGFESGDTSAWSVSVQ